jgi:uncharacterized protein
MRVILGLIIGYLLYLAVRKVALGLGLWPQAPLPRGNGKGAPDVLVQDPVCGTFIPRREALKTEKNGKVYFFCSEGCLKRFLQGGGR